jgi:RES domain-containing protein
VPSAIVPETFNVVLNPSHDHAAQIDVVRVSAHVIDPRLVR